MTRRFVKLTIWLILAVTPAFAQLDAYLIDVRSEKEYNAGHIDGALHMPYEKIGELITDKIVDKQTPIILYCGSGRRAGIAAETLKNLGYTAVENGGGIDDMRKRFPSDSESE